MQRVEKRYLPPRPTHCVTMQSVEKRYLPPRPSVEASDSSVEDCIVYLVVKASASRAEGPGFEFRLRRDFSGVESYQGKLALQWLPYQAPGVIGSVLGLVGPVSVYCDWLKWKVGSATSVSVWQQVQLSEQVRP